MGYTALKKMEVHIPKASNARGLRYAQDAIAFIREDCENLKFDTTNSDRRELKDNDGKSYKKGVIPYNMERDLDRLCLENAIARFVKSGSREDAFDIYYCYCVIFKPFGEGTQAARLLLDLLSEHETNASSLMKSHRDHYSHSVYVFLTGLAIYKKHERFQNTYRTKYGLNPRRDQMLSEAEAKKQDQAAAHHFLEYWGFTSLFHDIGYPFEIAFNQVKHYACQLGLIKESDSDDTKRKKEIVDKTNSALINMDAFFNMDLHRHDAALSDMIDFRLGIYRNRSCGSRRGSDTTQLSTIGGAQVRNGSDFLDHAYFGALVLTELYMKGRAISGNNDKANHPIGEDDPIQDCLCSIMLHNSLFKHTLRNKHILDTNESFSLSDGMPLSYLLMLCDELQSWDRKAFGHETRARQYPIDFDLTVTADSLSWIYYFDETFGVKAKKSGCWIEMSYCDYVKKGKNYTGCQYLDDLDRIICLQDVIPSYRRGMPQSEYERIMKPDLRPRQLRTGVYLSSGNYMNLYSLALELNARYEKIDDLDQDIDGLTEDEKQEKIKKYKEKIEKAFEEELSLEYKLSNIAQAKGFAAQLHSIGCFYTDRPIDSDPVIQFQQIELDRISESEHNRWYWEKLQMGWIYGEEYASDKTKRDRYRRHSLLVPYDELSDEIKAINAAAMNVMVKRIYETEGLVIYHF